MGLSLTKMEMTALYSRRVVQMVLILLNKLAFVLLRVIIRDNGKVLVIFLNYTFKNHYELQVTYSSQLPGKEM